MRESFFEKMTSGCLFKATSTQNQDSRNEFRESAHVGATTELVGPGVDISLSSKK